MRYPGFVNPTHSTVKCKQCIPAVIMLIMHIVTVYTEIPINYTTTSKI